MTAILDYTSGNISSIQKILASLKENSKVVSSGEEIMSADRIILPGVGHFSRAMSALEDKKLVEVLHEAVLVKRKPILGICLGMQLMTKYSEEGNAEGLGWFDCTTELLPVSNTQKYKIPHTGWNTINHLSSRIFKDVPNQSEMYFVHQYGVITANSTDVLCTTEYESEFVSGIQRDNIIGLQFHPEKSHDLGRTIFRNFLSL